jgi:multidrug efflux pump subunit AcrA (membrane-fusion protein)
VVLVAKGETADGRARFEKRVVVVDEGRAEGLVAVNSGLAPGERIVVRGAVLVLGAM